MNSNEIEQINNMVDTLAEAVDYLAHKNHD